MTSGNRAWVTVAAIALRAAPAAAEPQTAESLFREGRALIKAGQIAAGCAKLEASDRLEASVGTLLNLGDCFEKLGKRASAWAAFQRAEDLAFRRGGDYKRRTEAHRRAARIEHDMTWLIIDVGHRVDGFVVKRDGEVVNATTWNRAVPIDPGTYTIVADAPGYRQWRSVVSIVNGTRTISIPDLERIAPEPPARVPAAAPVLEVGTKAPPRAATVIATAPIGTWTPTRVLAVGVATGGAITLGVGIYFGTRARSLEHRADAICPATMCGDPAALQLNAHARDAATHANILLATGGAAVAAATVLWVFGRPNQAIVTPTVGPALVGASVMRRF